MDCEEDKVKLGRKIEQLDVQTKSDRQKDLGQCALHAFIFFVDSLLKVHG